MVIAVIEKKGGLVETGGDVLKDAAQGMSLCRREGSLATLVQAPLDKVLEFPQEEALIKALLKGNASLVFLTSTLDLDEQQLIDGSPIPLFHLGVRQALDGIT